MKWHILTGEYPPNAGGVGDYTALLAAALVQAGDSVDVWVGGAAPAAASGSARVHTLPDVFGPRSRTVLRDAWNAAPGTVLLQYVPNALGCRGMNLAFCRWLLRQPHVARDVRVMFHEPYFYFTLSRPWRNVAAVVQRFMAATLARAADQCYYSSESWHAYLRPYGAQHNAIVLPIPATIPGDARVDRVREFRRQFARDGARVVGHFGTFGTHVGDELTRTVPALLEADIRLRIALIGRNGDRFRQNLVSRMPSAADRIDATGGISPEDVAAAISACDILVQPYPDGVTTRRTSVMAGLRNGVAIVSTAGPLTERVWRDTGAVILAPSKSPDAVVTQVRQLLDDAGMRTAQGARGRAAYIRHFSMEQTVRALRTASAAVAV